MDKSKIDGFFRTLDEYPLNEVDKGNVRFIVDYVQNRHDPELSSKSFIFIGDPGIGKTFLAEKLVSILEKEVIYLGCAKMKLKNSVQCSSLKDVVKEVDNSKEQIIFMDDLNYIFNKQDYEITPEDKRDFMKILEIVKRNSCKLLVCTLNDLKQLDEQMVDRIEVKIYFDVPTDISKKNFLDAKFSKYLSKNELLFIAKNSIGYNYRDLPEMLKLAYRLGDGTLSKEKIVRALKTYKPTQLYGFKVENAIPLKLKDIIGKEEPLRNMKRIVQIYKNEGITEQLGLRRANLLLFHGLPGTGKSFAAKALAGEIGFPLINISGGDLMRDPFYQISKIGDMGRRYRNCVIFVDEAEKMFGNPRYGEDNNIIGEFNRQFDCLHSNDIKAIVILAVNDMTRFGDSLKDRFVHVEFKLPEYVERLAFCKAKVEGSKKFLKHEFSYHQLAKQTENLSFREIERVWNELMFEYLENKERITVSTITKTIRNLKPQEDNTMFG